MKHTLESAMPAEYSTVTELPGNGATEEQLAMLYTRYRIAADLADSKDVLELACGPGIGLGYLAKKARNVVGGDCDPQLLDAARKHYGHRIEIRQLDAQNLPFDSNTFDLVLLLEAIYYLPEPERFLAEARRVLRHNGMVFICSANKEWAGFNPSPFSFLYYSARELRQLLAQQGFSPQVFAAFPAINNGVKNQLYNAIRRTAVQLHMIPRTMHGKAILKRALYGKLSPLPSELTDDGREPQPLVPVSGNSPVSRYKVIYAVGCLSDGGL